MSPLLQVCDCSGCPYKDKCIKGNNCKIPKEERTKVLMYQGQKEEKGRKPRANPERLRTQLRMNRSIQAEGTFAVVKEDMGFRQYLYRGMKNALAESVLVAIAYNFNKLHWKIQSQKLELRLYELNKTA